MDKQFRRDFIRLTMVGEDHFLVLIPVGLIVSVEECKNETLVQYSTPSGVLCSVLVTDTAEEIADKLGA